MHHTGGCNLVGNLCDQPCAGSNSVVSSGNGGCGYGNGVTGTDNGCGSATSVHSVPLKVQVSLGKPSTIGHGNTGCGCGCGCGGYNKKDDVPSDAEPEHNDAH